MLTNKVNLPPGTYGVFSLACSSDMHATVTSYYVCFPRISVTLTLFCYLVPKTSRKIASCYVLVLKRSMVRTMHFSIQSNPESAENVYV